MTIFDVQNILYKQSLDHKFVNKDIHNYVIDCRNTQ